MTFEQITSEALQLSDEERAYLAESLWTSLSDPFKAPADMNDAAALALALERDREIETGKVKPVSHEDLMARLRR